MEDDTQQLPTLTENDKRSRSRTNSNSSQKNRCRSYSKDRGHFDEVEIVRRNVSTLDKRVLTAYNELREQQKTTGKTHKYYYNKISLVVSSKEVPLGPITRSRLVGGKPPTDSAHQ